MRTHVEFLGLLYLVWGALGLLVGLASVALGVGAATIVRAGAAEPGTGLAAWIVAATFFVVGVVMLGWGTAHAGDGLALRRLRPWSRAVGLGLGFLNLLMLPFGTALGIYALWVLLNNETRELFYPSG